MDGPAGEDAGGPVGRAAMLVRSKYLFRIGAAVLVVTVVLLGAGAVTLQQTQASVGANAEETLENAAEREAMGLDEFVDKRNADVVRMSGAQSVVTGDLTGIEAELRTNQAILPESVVAIHYYNTNSDTIEASVRPGSVGEEFDENDRPWAVDFDAYDGHDDARSFEPYEVDGQKRLGFASPVEGRQSHAIVLEVDLQQRGALLSSPVEGGVVEAVSTTDGTVTVSNDTDAILGESFLLEELPHLSRDTSETRTDQVDVGSDRIDDGRAVVATAPLAEKNWVVVVAAPESTLFATVGEVGRNILLLIAVAVLGFVAVSGYISRDINSSLSTLRQHAAAIEAGDLDVDIDQSRTDEFGELSAVFARLRDTLREQIQTAERSAREAREARDRAERAQEDAETARQEAEEFTRRLERTAAEYHEAIDAAADGDLTRRLDPDTESDAMAEIGAAINRMLEDIETLVVRIQAAAAEVDDRSSEVTASADDIEATSREVAESIDEISTGASTQREQLGETTAEMNDLSATVEQIASSSSEIAGQVRGAADRGESGRETATEAIREIDHIETQVGQAVDEVDMLRDEVERIGEVVELIDDIAEETNILALNASIEAARAGDAGEGFAVVADEVKALAEETAEATQEVERLVEDVETSTEAVADDMFAVQERIGSGRRTVEETVDALEGIVEDVDDANAGVQSIDAATDQQADSTAEVVSMIDDVVEISDRTAEEAGTVAAAAEEQTSSIQEIAANSETLSDRAEELQALVERFETGDGTGQPGTDSDIEGADSVDAPGEQHSPTDDSSSDNNDRTGLRRGDEDSSSSGGRPLPDVDATGDEPTDLVVDED